MRIVFFVLTVFFISACKETKRTLPGYSGAVGEVVVVIPDQQWNNEVGEKIKEYFQQNQTGLPQAEAVLKLVNIPPKNFTSIFETHRNLIIVEVSKDKTPGISVSKNVWAKDQQVIRVDAKTNAEAVSLLDEKAEKMMYSIRNKEIERLIKRNKKFGSETINKKMYKKHKLSLITQKDAYVATDSSNFVWIRIERERPVGGFQHQISQGILVYYYNYTDTSQFHPSALLAVRDSITKKYVPGPSDSSYMATSFKLVAPEHQKLQFKGEYAVETRGLWRMENDFMGGPFVSLTTLDRKNARLVTAVGYVYAPQFPKREYVREVEAMVRSLSFD